MLIGALVGAAVQRLATTLIKPFSYYISLLELRLLRNQIDEQTRNQIVRALTFNYFLGESAASPGSDRV